MGEAMGNVVKRCLAVIVGAASVGAFYTSTIDLPFWGFLVALVALGLFTSLILGDGCGMFAGLGVIGAFAVIGIHNAIDRGADIGTYLTLPFALAAMLFIAAIGSVIGDVIRPAFAATLDSFKKA